MAKIQFDSVEVGQKISLSPNAEKGTWTGYDANIAIINDNNEVEGVNEGSAMRVTCWA